MKENGLKNIIYFSALTSCYKEVDRKKIVKTKFILVGLCNTLCKDLLGVSINSRAYNFAMKMKLLQPFKIQGDDYCVNKNRFYYYFNN